jgi:hypothetical protein
MAPKTAFRFLEQTSKKPDWNQPKGRKITTRSMQLLELLRKMAYQTS